MSLRHLICVSLIAASSFASGCSTIESLSSDDPTTPKIYGGVRLHLRGQSEADAGSEQLGKKVVAAIFDLPLSAICDTLLLPVTAFLEPDSPEEIQEKNRSEDERRSAGRKA